jgi:hypothetical protein
MLTWKRKEHEPNSPVLNLFRHGQEGLFDICRILRGGLKEGDGKLIGKFLRIRCNEINMEIAKVIDYGQTFATPYSTTFLLVRSDLLPTSNLFTPSEA